VHPFDALVFLLARTFNAAWKHEHDGMLTQVTMYHVFNNNIFCKKPFKNK